MRTRSTLSVLAAVLVAAAAAVGPAEAAGDLATRTTRLDLKLGSKDNDYAISQADFQLETGKAYRLSITSNGSKEMAWVAPEFFRNIWVREVKVGELEVHTSVVEHVEFDGEGTIDLYLVPIRTGTYGWEIEGLADKGMKGTLVVK